MFVCRGAALGHAGWVGMGLAGGPELLFTDCFERVCLCVYVCVWVGGGGSHALEGKCRVCVCVCAVSHAACEHCVCVCVLGHHMCWITTERP